MSAPAENVVKLLPNHTNRHHNHGGVENLWKCGKRLRKKKGNTEKVREFNATQTIYSRWDYEIYKCRIVKFRSSNNEPIMKYLTTALAVTPNGNGICQ